MHIFTHNKENNCLCVELKSITLGPNKTLECAREIIQEELSGTLNVAVLTSVFFLFFIKD